MITVVLDDDPTGTQAMSDVSVVLDWSDAGVWKCVEPGDCAVSHFGEPSAGSAGTVAWRRNLKRLAKAAKT